MLKATKGVKKIGLRILRRPLGLQRIQSLASFLFKVWQSNLSTPFPTIHKHHVLSWRLKSKPKHHSTHITLKFIFKSLPMMIPKDLATTTTMFSPYNRPYENSRRKSRFKNSKILPIAVDDKYCRTKYFVSFCHSWRPCTMRSWCWSWPCPRNMKR